MEMYDLALELLAGVPDSWDGGAEVYGVATIIDDRDNESCVCAVRDLPLGTKPEFWTVAIKDGTDTPTDWLVDTESMASGASLIETMHQICGLSVSKTDYTDEATLRYISK